MPNDFRLRVGDEVATVQINATPAQIAAALQRYAESLGIPLEGTASEQLRAILLHW